MLDLTRIAREKKSCSCARRTRIAPAVCNGMTHDIEDRHLKLSVALLASHYELVADHALGAGFFGTYFATLANYGRKKARFLCGGINPTPKESPRRSAIMVSASNHNLSEVSLLLRKGRFAERRFGTPVSDQQSYRRNARRNYRDARGTRERPHLS